MAEDTDFHIDTKLENLFHADSPGLQHEDGGEDDITAENLPEWLIGVIVVIILLVIAFFAMVLSSIIKNKRKNRLAAGSDNNSSTHICDDLELGKIGQVDPRYQVPACIPEGKNSEAHKCGTSPEEEFMSSSCQALPEASSSSVSNDGSQSLCGCRNPLFVDDEPEVEKEQGNQRNNDDGKIENLNVERCCKSKGQFHKHKNSKSVCKDLKSVDELYDEEKLNADLTRLNEMKEKEKDDSALTSSSDHQDGITQSTDEADHDGHVLVHHSGEVTSSRNPDSSSEMQSPVLESPDKADEAVPCNNDLETSLQVFDASMDSQEDNTKDTEMEKGTSFDLVNGIEETCQTSHEAAGQLDPQQLNIPTEFGNTTDNKSTTDLEHTKAGLQDGPNSSLGDCPSTSETETDTEQTGEDNSEQSHKLAASTTMNGDVLELENDERAFTKL